MREALRDAMAEEMRRDESVYVMGEDVAVFQGAFKVTEGLLDEFGEKRVRDTPISENTIVGTGVGSAMGGLRPVVELMTVNFALLAFDQIINHAAAIPYMFNGQARVPMVVRMPGGGGHQLGPTHSHSFEAMFLQIPGLLVACPSTPADGKGLLKAAIRDDNPVIFIEHETLYGARGEVPDGDDHVLNFGEAAIRREGTDVTIVGILRMAHIAQQAAKTLANEHGVEAEVIDPRTLRPLDLDTILESVRKTNRLVIVEEGWPHGGVGANIAALVTEQAFDHLDAPVQRVTGADVPMPYSKRLEQSAIPHAEHVVSAALATTRGSAALMATDIVMPRLSDSMEEGTVLKWMKSVGDEVALGEELVEIETDKANMVFEADAAGTLIEIVAGEGDTLPIGEVIARVGEPGEAPSGNGASDGARSPRQASSPAADSPPEPDPRRPRTRRRARRLPRPSQPGRPTAEDGRVKASPLARRIAEGEGGRSGARCRARGPAGGSSRRTWRAQAGGARRGAAAPPRPRRGRRSGDRRCAARSPETAKGHGRGRRADQAAADRRRGGWPSRRRPRRTSICRPNIDMTPALGRPRRGSRRRRRRAR